MQREQDRQDSRTEVIAEPTTASPPEPLPSEDHLLSVGQLPRQRVEVETPTSYQSPRVNQGCRRLGPAALHTCPLASPRSQVRARLGPAGTIVGVLGAGVPRLVCLRPTAWLHQRPGTAHLHQQTLKTLARGQASRGGRHKTSSGAASLGWLARSGEMKERAPREVSVT